MHRQLLLCVVVVITGCGAQVQRDAEDAATDGGADAKETATAFAPPVVVDAGPGADADAGAPDPSFGCSAETAPRTCWKCCANVPALRSGADAYFRDVLPCLCKLPTRVAGCAATCATPSTTPDPECSPWLQAHAAECRDGVAPGDGKAVEAFVACTNTCPTGP